MFALFPADSQWSFQMKPAVNLSILAVVYVGLVLRRSRVRHRVEYARILSWYVGLAVIALALMSPIDAVADDQSYMMHMIQHELLMTVAPLLLLMGLDPQLLAPITKWIFRPVMRRSGPTRALRLATMPILGLVLWGAAISLWSVPIVVRLASDNENFHQFGHATSFAVGMLFWGAILAPYPTLHRQSTVAKLWLLGAVNVITGAVTGVLAFAPSPLYRIPYVASEHHWLGLSPLTDQRLAGALMMIVCMTATLAAAVWVVSRTPHRRTATPTPPIPRPGERWTLAPDP
jgi:cytochrome c oxidase assembly factor CtaG